MIQIEMIVWLWDEDETQNGQRWFRLRW